MSEAVIKINVDFTKSRSGVLVALGRSIPQFFDSSMKPLEDANAYLRTLARKQTAKSLLTSSEHVIEFLRWLLDSSLDLEDMDDGLFDSYVDALCAYAKPDGSQLSWNTVNSRASGAYRFLKWAHSKNLCPGVSIQELGTVKSGTKFKYKSRGHADRATKESVSFLLIDDSLKFIDALGTSRFSPETS
ncbi:hypothetical protein, partial [Zhongshania sp.]|uniref:hypothetical protein n=1 Tax=Zhongshania sp. TaxID=1971902 RepID=UPI003568B864